MSSDGFLSSHKGVKKLRGSPTSQPCPRFTHKHTHFYFVSCLHVATLAALFENLFKFSANIRLESRKDWHDFDGQSSKWSDKMQCKDMCLKDTWLTWVLSIFMETCSNFLWLVSWGISVKRFSAQPSYCLIFQNGDVSFKTELHFNLDSRFKWFFTHLPPLLGAQALNVQHHNWKDKHRHWRLTFYVVYFKTKYITLYKCIGCFTWCAEVLFTLFGF